MGLKSAWEKHCLPGLIDRVCRSGPILEERRRWVGRAEGEVLEIGVGSGLNFIAYDPAKVGRLVGIDPSAPLLARAAARTGELGFPVELRNAPAEKLPFDARSFDSAVVTYTLCSVGDVSKALAELRRVLRPGGKLVFIEHGAAPDARPRRWQQRITPVWRHISGNCHLDRDVRAELEAAGFGLDVIEAAYTEDGPRWMTFTSAGVAVTP